MLEKPLERVPKNAIRHRSGKLYLGAFELENDRSVRGKKPGSREANSRENCKKGQTYVKA
jgi:hypothetical protein